VPFLGLVPSRARRMPRVLGLAEGVYGKHDSVSHGGLKYTKRNKMRYMLSKLFSFSTNRVFTISGFVGLWAKSV